MAAVGRCGHPHNSGRASGEAGRGAPARGGTGGRRTEGGRCHVQLSDRRPTPDSTTPDGSRTRVDQCDAIGFDYSTPDGSRRPSPPPPPAAAAAGGVEATTSADRLATEAAPAPTMASVVIGGPPPPPPPPPAASAATSSTGTPTAADAVPAVVTFLGAPPPRLESPGPSPMARWLRFLPQLCAVLLQGPTCRLPPAAVSPCARCRCRCPCACGRRKASLRSAGLSILYPCRFLRTPGLRCCTEDSNFALAVSSLAQPHQQAKSAGAVAEPAKPEAAGRKPDASRKPALKGKERQAGCCVVAHKPAGGAAADQARRSAKQEQVRARLYSRGGGGAGGYSRDGDRNGRDGGGSGYSDTYARTRRR